MRYVVMIAGMGGMGILTAGQILAEAGMQKYPHVTWFPSYDARQRGGFSECTVILSDKEIYSPVTLDLEAIIVMHVFQTARFRDVVTPGALVIAEKGCGLERSDIKELEIPGEETASRLGSPLAANQVFLGAYIVASGCLPPEEVDGALERRYRDKENVLTLNRRAFWEGVRLAGGS